MSVNFNNILNTTKHCETLYDGKKYLSDLQRYILITFDLIIIMLNITANIIVMVTIVKKKLLINHSTRLILYHSISDYCVAFVSQSVYIVILSGFFNMIACTFDLVTQMCSTYTCLLMSSH